MSGVSKKQLDRPALQIALATVLVIAAFLVRQMLVLRFGIELPAFITFYPAIMFIALLSGLWAGLLATALATVMAALWVFSPVGQFRIEDVSDAIALVLFFSMGVFMSVVAERYRRNQRKLAAARQELALRETREQLEEMSAHQRLALEAAELGAWDYHLESGEVLWDERCRNGFGFAAGESMRYEAAIERIHPEDRPAVDEAVKLAIAQANDGAFHREFRVVWPDGAVHWISSHGRVYFDGEGGQRRATRFIGVNTDITERKQTESVLQTTLRRFYAILSNLFSGVLLVTNEGRVEFVNQAFCDRFGLTDSPAALAGLESVVMIEKIRHAYRHPGQAMTRIQELVNEGRAVIGEELPMRDGGTCLRDFVPLEVEGKSFGRLWVHTDISERKQVEARLRRFYETDLFAILYWKIDGGVVDANDRFLKITGYTREDVRAGLVSWAEITPPEYHAADEDARRQIRETGLHQPYEKEFIRKDGTRVWGQFWAAAYQDDRSQGVSFILDITERKQIENELRQAKREWERTFDSVPDLIAILDNQHRIVRVNQAMAQRLGATPESCAGLECFACVHGASAPLGMCPHTLTLKDHREHAAELHEDRLGGDFLVTTTPLLDERGEMDGAVHVARDITEHKRAEDALKESEKRYRNLFNTMNEGFCIIEVLFGADGKPEDYRFLEVNDAFERQTGLHNAEGKRMRELAPAHEEYWFEIYGRIALTGEPAHFMEEAAALNRWYDVHAYRVGDPEMRRVAIVFNDFSDYKRAEQALREQAELLDLAHETIMVCDLDGTIRFWNHGAEEMYGYSKQQATGKKAHELLSTVFPQPMGEIKARIVREGRWEGELAHVTRDGTGMIVDSRWVLQRDKNGAARGVMEINSDITTRVRAEEAQREAHLKLQSVIDSITDGLLVLDNDWRFTYCSEHGARILGLRPEDLVGSRVWELFPHAENSKFGEAYRRALQSGLPVHFEESYPEPLNMWLECHCYPTDEGLSVYFRDISERKRTEEALLRSEKLASVGRMAATIAHEINNPLAAITNTLFLARMKADEPASVREFLDVAEDELKRITHITRQTLGFYRESANPAVVSVNAVLESAVDLMKSKIVAKRAVIEKEWKGETKISAIAGELRQVFSNLLGNSLDAIDEGGAIKLRVSSGTDFKQGRRSVRVTVADNGKGITASSKPHIFEPFFTTKGTVGTGLGLWVIRQIVDKHHGTVHMRSCTDGENRGTVFMVILPVESPAKAQTQS